MTIYVLSGFNNYYNRVVKKFNTIGEYMPYKLHTQLNFNFVPNDNVNTQVVLGSNVNNYNGEGDYLLAVNELNEIVSRWFIIESVRDRAGQFTLTLHRDLVADHYNELLDAPMFIEKATLPYESPLLFNEENITVNQIKTSETLLKDKSKCPWLVGYYAKDVVDLTGSVPKNDLSNIPFLQISTPVESWKYYDFSNLAPEKKQFKSTNIKNASYNVSVNVQGFDDAYNPPRLAYNKFHTYTTQWNSWVTTDGGQTESTNSTLIFSSTNIFNITNAASGPINNAYTHYGSSYSDDRLANYISDVIADGTVNELNQISGSLIRDINGRFFDVRVNETNTTYETTQNLVSGTTLFEGLKTIYQYAGFTGTPNNSSFSVTISLTQYEINLIERFDLNTEFDLTGDKLVCEDAPWNIFAIPYGAVNIVNDLGLFLLTTNKEIGMATAVGMQQTGKLHDIQLLPYCPVQDLISDDGEITVTDSLQYSFIVDNSINTNVGIIFNIPRSTFTFDVTDIIIQPAQTAIQKKINNECDKWRLTSPNYSNYFDFSVEKNGGIQYFNIDCNYKPFTPYIHINPNFGNLYGYDDNSPRGLILGGDFSLSQIIDLWEQYQLQNKNFQNIFDRQIQNMEVQHKYQRIQEAISGIAGVGSGAAGGALVGSAIMPGVGTIAGAAAGGIASLGGMIGDLVINEKLRDEALDYTKDMFGYQLGNIQALPQTISKVSAFNSNNKMFPILEYYTCTPEEKTALVNKIAYNGMTVMRIGTMREFVNNSWSYGNIESKGYIKGKLIRLETVEDDYHIINALSGELDKGVYIK